MLNSVQMSIAWNALFEFVYSARGLVGLGVQVGYADGAGVWSPRLIALIGAGLAALVAVPPFLTKGRSMEQCTAPISLTQFH